MQVYEFSIGLRFWHPTVDLAAITQELGLAPDHSWRVGDRRVSPSGRDIGGLRPESYWHTNSTGAEWRNSGSGGAEAAITALLERLETHSGFLESFANSGGRALIHLNLHGTGNFAVEFSPSILTKCGRLGFALATDVYEDRQGSVA
jgi:hypothetical protein